MAHATTPSPKLTAADSADLARRALDAGTPIHDMLVAEFRAHGATMVTGDLTDADQDNTDQADTNEPRPTAAPGRPAIPLGIALSLIVAYFALLSGLLATSVA
ncbi:hypothetical protein [Rhodococcus ruber]|uniref:hypothetical protein n=1 Tax=Rhodococcus ruber TaxID=1830 RepID=UPI0037835B43